MTTQGVSSTQHISQAQANTALGAEGQHNPAPTSQQTEQVHHYNQAEMNLSTANNQAVYYANQVNPAPALQQRKHTQPIDQARSSTVTVSEYVQAAPYTTDTHSQVFLPGNQVKYYPAQVKQAKDSNTTS